MGRTWAILVALILVLIPISSNSEELKFLFSTDQDIKPQDTFEGILARKDVVNDSWFSRPPTRIELITYLLDQHVKAKGGYLDGVGKYFEEVEGKGSFAKLPLVNASAFFSSEKGCFVIEVDFSQLGKPKRPMKEFCDHILTWLLMDFVIDGYLLENTILRPFITKSPDDPEVLRIVNLLKKNTIALVTLDATYGNVKNGYPRDHYFLSGYRSTQEKETHYVNKRTFSLK